MVFVTHRIVRGLYMFKKKPKRIKEKLGKDQNTKSSYNKIVAKTNLLF
jgi:hypothetical protein